jgi:hypothetical protein
VSQIFELFGYPLTDKSDKAQSSRRRAWCPFMNRECDGGGNRPQSSVKLESINVRYYTPEERKSLKDFFDGHNQVHAGVCSLQLTPSTAPWIVCPRRLLSLTRERGDQDAYQRDLELALLKTLDYPSGTRLGIWSEMVQVLTTDKFGREWQASLL